jgi:hypothetical protein
MILVQMSADEMTHCTLKWRHDILHNDNQHYDIQHNGPDCGSQYNITRHKFLISLC